MLGGRGGHAKPASQQRHKAHHGPDHRQPAHASSASSRNIATQAMELQHHTQENILNVFFKKLLALESE